MIHRNIRPAQEEINGAGVGILVLFCAVWYSSIIRGMMSGGFAAGYILFLIAGLLPLNAAITGVRRAVFYRRLRKEAIQTGRACSGRIVNVTQKQVPYSGRHGRTVYQKMYCLTVEITDPVTGVTSQIESQEYRLPVHRYLSSPQVKVYIDTTGWKYYLEDFQLKQHRNDPGIFPKDREFEEPAGSQMLVRLVFFLVLVWILVQQFRR